MNESYIRNAIEAALLAAGKPLQIAELTQIFDENSRPKAEEVRAALDALAGEYSARGIEVKETAAGFRIQVRREFAGEVSRLWPERPAKYSRALLETLALIAYRQPITRAEIEAVRGVSVNPNILKTVLERGWVRVVGHRDVPGRPELLGTTREFLDYFGLRSLDDLPPLAELKAMGDINLQLELSPETSADGAAAANDGSGDGKAADAVASSAEVGAGADGHASAEASPAGDVQASAEASNAANSQASVEANTTDAQPSDENAPDGSEPAALTAVHGSAAAELTAPDESAAAAGLTASEGSAAAGLTVSDGSAAAELNAADKSAAAELNAADGGTQAGVSADDGSVAADRGAADGSAGTELAEARAADAIASAEAAESGATDGAGSTSEPTADEILTADSGGEARHRGTTGHSRHEPPAHEDTYGTSEESKANASDGDSDDSADVLGDNASDDESEDDELSADGNDSRELVAAPRHFED